MLQEEKKRKKKKRKQLNVKLAFNINPKVPRIRKDSAVAETSKTKVLNPDVSPKKETNGRF